MSLYDLLKTLSDNSEELTNVLINLDSCLEYLHNHGFCIINFDPKKIMLIDGHFSINSFNGLLNDINIVPNSKQLNLLQASKIGLMAYNGMPIDGNMNQEHFNLIRQSLSKFKSIQVPEMIFEYYEEIFYNLNFDYLNNFLVKKDMEERANQQSNVYQKTKTTPIGQAFKEKDNGFVNILFIPTLLSFIYILSLFFYVLILK